MKIVGAEIIEEAQKKHANASSRLAAWRAEVAKKDPPWASFLDLRRQFPSVDKVGDRYVFEIGNRYRLIAKMNFAVGVASVRWFGTHAEYDRLIVEEV